MVMGFANSIPVAIGVNTLRETHPVIGRNRRVAACVFKIRDKVKTNALSQADTRLFLEELEND